MTPSTPSSDAEATNLHHVQLRADWTAALVTLRDFRSWGSYRMAGPGEEYGTQRGVSFRAYLILRDASTHAAHILRVPPRYGNPDTKFFGRFGTDRERIHAAIAWTFDLESKEYRPQVEA